MKTFVDGDNVFVGSDNFQNLQDSEVVFGDCHDFCAAATVAMLSNKANRHVSYISPQDLDPSGFGLKEGGKIPRVTIEFVDESETARNHLMRTMTIQIGNTDNKLSQGEFAHYVSAVARVIKETATEIHFFGGSETWALWQNVAWVINIPEEAVEKLKNALTLIRENYEQESVAVAVYDQDFC